MVQNLTHKLVSLYIIGVDSVNFTYQLINFQKIGSNFHLSLVVLCNQSGRMDPGSPGISSPAKVGRFKIAKDPGSHCHLGFGVFCWSLKKVVHKATYEKYWLDFQGEIMKIGFLGFSWYYFLVRDSHRMFCLNRHENDECCETSSRCFSSSWLRQVKSVGCRWISPGYLS